MASRHRLLYAARGVNSDGKIQEDKWLFLEPVSGREVVGNGADLHEQNSGKVVAEPSP
jgi:hypothetical protein